MDDHGPAAHAPQLGQARFERRHWWIVIIAIAASNASSSNGSDSATASTAGSVRCARIDADGSTATT